MACTTGKSRLEMELSSKRPRPEMAKTCSMITLPATMSATVMARNATVGTTALRSTWRYRAARGELPRLYAVRT